MNTTKQMVLPKTIEDSIDALPQGVCSNGHWNGVVQDCVDVQPTPIDRDFLKRDAHNTAIAASPLQSCVICFTRSAARAESQVSFGPLGAPLGGCQFG